MRRPSEVAAAVAAGALAAAIAASGIAAAVDAPRGTAAATRPARVGAPNASTSPGMIAYTYQLDSTTFAIATINPDGSGDVIGPAGRAQPRFSPDGNRMLAWDFSGTGAATMYVRNVDGTNERPLTPQKPGTIWEAAWSPDGRQIAYMLSQGGNAADAELWVMNADGTRQVQLTSDGMAKLPHAIDWAQTPTGSRIAYVGGASTDPADPCYGWQVRTIAPDGSGAACVTSASYGQMLPFGAVDLAWSPDGTKLALVSTYCGADGCDTACVRDGVCFVPGDVWMLDVVADTTRDLTTSRGLGAFRAKSVTWSPDGATLALGGLIPLKLITGTSASVAGVFLMPATGGAARRITPPTETATVNVDVPSWQRCTAGVTKVCTSGKRVTAPPAAGPPALKASATATYARGTLKVAVSVSRAATARIVIAEPGAGTFRSRAFTVKAGASTITVAVPLGRGAHRATVAITVPGASITRTVRFAVG